MSIFQPQIKDANGIIDLAAHDIDACSFLLNKQSGTMYARAGTSLTSKRADYASNFLDYEDNIDALLIATPVSTHFPFARDSLSAGKHVFIEKPLTATSDEARKLYRLRIRISY